MLRVSRVVLLSLLVVALTSPAFATTSRVASLAGTSNYINDDSNIFRWYGTLPSYTRMVMAEVGQAVPQGGSAVNATRQAMGFTHSFGEDHWLGTWALFLLYNSVEDQSFFLFNPLQTTQVDGVPSPTTKFVLAWGDEVEGLSWGITFTRSDMSTETTAAPGAKQSQSFTTIGAGIRADLGDDAYLDAVLTIGSAGGDTTVAGTTSDKWDKSTSWEVAVRGFYERGFGDLVPYFSYQNWNYDVALATPTSGDKGNAFQLGLSMNFDVNTNNLLIFATELNFIHEEPSRLAAGDQTETNTRHIPRFYVALESDINSWFTVRAGATKTMERIEATAANGDKTTTTASTVNGQDFGWSLGAGFHLGDWDIDAVVEEDVPFRLGYWLTGFGGDDPNSPVSRVTAIYRF